MAPLKGTPICDPSVGSFQLSLAPFLPLYLTHTIQTHTHTHHVHVPPPLRVAYHHTRTRTRTRTLTTPRAQHHTPHCHHYITLRHLLASTYYITRRCMPARTYICVCTRMLSSSFISSSTSFRPFLLTSPLTHPPSPDLETRVNDIASRIPMAELPNLFSDVTVGVPSLNIPQYNWWSEALHGTRRI